MFISRRQGFAVTEMSRHKIEKITCACPLKRGNRMRFTEAERGKLPYIG